MTEHLLGAGRTNSPPRETSLSGIAEAQDTALVFDTGPGKP